MNVLLPVSDTSLQPLEYHQQARSWLKTMRDTQPIAWDEENKSWLIFRYEDIVRIQSDYQTFSSEPLEGLGGSLFEQDPPLHRQRRSLIVQSFSPKMIAGLAPQIELVVDRLLTKIMRQDSNDWMIDMAHPLPIIVMARLLGLPVEEWRQFKAWTDMTINRDGGRGQSVMHFNHFFAREIFKRRRRPGRDLLSQLIFAEAEGEHLAYDELLTFCRTLFIAGNVTTSRVLGNAMLYFSEHPQAYQQLRLRPELLPGAVEEILRYMSPHPPCPNSNVINTGRRATKDLYFYDQLVRKGEKLHISRFSANFDERHFTDPERFDIERSPNRHQTFGHGIHFCIGAQLTRMELSIMLKRVLQTVQDVQVIPGEPLLRDTSSLVFSVQRLPLRLVKL